MTPHQLAARIVTLDWSTLPLQHQLAICAVLETLLSLPAMEPPVTPCNVLPFPNVTHRWVRILHLDGREWCKAGFTGPSDSWAWVQETVAHELGCSEDDVGCAESEDGDLVTVDGLPAYRIAHGLPKN